MIVDCITHFFMNLYSEQQVVRPFSEVLVFPRISCDNADWIDRPFEKANIFDIIQNFNGNKSLGPDGYPMAFFQAYWEILKPELIAVFHHFFAKG